MLAAELILGKTTWATATRPLRRDSRKDVECNRARQEITHEGPDLLLQLLGHLRDGVEQVGCEVEVRDLHRRQPGVRELAIETDLDDGRIGVLVDGGDDLVGS